MLSRVLAVASICVLLIGCSSTQQRTAEVDEEIEFGPADEASLVVIGTRANHFDSRDYLLIWRKIDPISGNLTREKVNSFQVSRSEWEVATTWDGLRGQRYHFVKVAPGTYALADLFQKTANDNWHTTFRPTTDAFTVSAGEIAYIGDYMFAFPEDKGALFSPTTTRAKLRRDGFAVESAEAALLEMPNVEGELVLREPEKIDLTNK